MLGTKYKHVNMHANLVGFSFHPAWNGNRSDVEKRICMRDFHWPFKEKLIKFPIIGLHVYNLLTKSRIISPWSVHIVINHSYQTLTTCVMVIPIYLFFCSPL